MPQCSLCGRPVRESAPGQPACADCAARLDEEKRRRKVIGIVIGAIVLGLLALLVVVAIRPFSGQADRATEDIKPGIRKQPKGGER